MAHLAHLAVPPLTFSLALQPHSAMTKGAPWPERKWMHGRASSSLVVKASDRAEENSGKCMCSWG